MTFAEAAMIMMSGGKKPNIKPLSVSQNGPYNAADYGADGFDPVLVNVPSAPLSLDGLNALRTFATVTIGAYTFEIKEPKLLYPGKVNVDIKKSYDSGTWECSWLPTVILNQTIAAIGNNRVAVESRSWGEYTDSYGNSYSKYYSSFSDFAVKNVTVYKSNATLPEFNIQWSYTQITGHDTGAGETYHGTSSSYITSFYEMDYPSLSGLSYDEYFKFVKNYLEKTAGVDPVVTIL